MDFMTIINVVVRMKLRKSETIAGRNI